MHASSPGLHGILLGLVKNKLPPQQTSMRIKFFWLHPFNNWAKSCLAGLYRTSFSIKFNLIFSWYYLFIYLFSKCSICTSLYSHFSIIRAGGMLQVMKGLLFVPHRSCKLTLCGGRTALAWGSPDLKCPTQPKSNRETCFFFHQTFQK